MKKFFALIIFNVAAIFTQAQQIEIPFLKYEELEEKISNESADLLVVNFWATTCAPCVKELPHFMEVNREHESDPNFKMLLVSLDRTKDLERVKKFIKDKNLSAEVVILDDNKRMNTWIPRIDADWGGEIPVTVLYYKGKKIKFHNGEMSKTELQESIAQYLR